MGPLAELNVIELPGNPAVRFCGRLFADLGANVAMVKAPGIVEDQSATAVAERIFFDRDKTPLTINLDDPAGLAALGERMAAADVVIAPGVPPRLRDAGLLTNDGAPGNPRLVLVLATDYGFDGPYADYRGSSMLGHAAGGYLYINGDPGREPLRGLEYHPYAQTGLSAFLAAMAALLERRRSGLGQRASASVMQTLAPLHEWTSVRYTHGGFVQRRVGNRYSVGYPIAMFPTKDGHICITLLDLQRSNLVFALAGHPELIDDPRFESLIGRHLNQEAYDAVIKPWLASKTNAELMADFEQIKLTAAPIVPVSGVLADPHFRARKFFLAFDGPDGSTVEVPGPPVRSLARTAAPLVDSWASRAAPDGSGPLAALRVLDLTAGWSGPHGLRMLGDLGADVIRVEAPWQRGTVPPDDDYVRETGFYVDNEPGPLWWERSGAHNKWAYNKRCIALRMNDPEGREVLRRLVQWADVVIDNFSTQAWEKLGVTYEWLSSVNPAVIAVTMPGYGRWGPAKYRVSYGNQIEAAIGADSLMGYEGGDPHMFCQAWPDPCAAMHAAAYALAGIWERETTGEGQFFEVSQAEGAMTFIGPELTRYSLTGEEPHRIGNRHERYAPHGVYPCAGEDRWLAVAATDDGAWAALASVLGRSDLAGLSLDDRRTREDEIDILIGGWTRSLDPLEAARLLQDAGVPAFAAYTAPDMVTDPYLRATSTFVEIDGETLPGFPYQLSRTPPRVHRGVAGLGEHNREVLSALRFADPEIDRLQASGVIADRPIP